MNQDKRSCMFDSYCIRPYCDMSCVRNAISEILLEKSGLNLTDSVFTADEEETDKCWNFLLKHEGSLCVLHDKHPLQKANLLTFSAICNLCEGHGSSVNIFHLKFTTYMNQIRSSWSKEESPQLKEVKAFVKSSKILIISGLDYCNLGDYECQEILNIMGDRQNSSFTTVFVSVNVGELSGKGSFIVPLKDKLKEVVV